MVSNINQKALLPYLPMVASTAATCALTQSGRGVWRKTQKATLSSPRVGLSEKLDPSHLTEAWQASSHVRSTNTSVKIHQPSHFAALPLQPVLVPVMPLLLAFPDGRGWLLLTRAELPTGKENNPSERVRG